jgi:hypothetical protein
MTARATGTRAAVRDEVGHHELAGQRGGRDAWSASVAYPGDAGGALSGPLAPHSFLGWEVGEVARQQRRRVGDDALDARRHVEHHRDVTGSSGPAERAGRPRARRPVTR